MFDGEFHFGDSSGGRGDGVARENEKINFLSKICLLQAHKHFILLLGVFKIFIWNQKCCSGWRKLHFRSSLITVPSWQELKVKLDCCCCCFESVSECEISSKERITFLWCPTLFYSTFSVYLMPFSRELFFVYDKSLRFYRRNTGYELSE